MPKSDPAAKEAGLKLARILYSEETQLAASDRLFDSQLAGSFRANADFQALEREYPGFIEAFLVEVKPVLTRHTKASLPQYYDQVASLLAQHLSKSDIEDLTRFYQTPTGRKLIAGMAQNVSIEAMLAEVSTGPDQPTSYAAVSKDHQAAIQRTAMLIDKSDEPVLREFVSKPYFLQLALLGPAMRKLDQDFANQPAPELDEEMTAVFERTIERLEASRRR